MKKINTSIIAAILVAAGGNVGAEIFDGIGGSPSKGTGQSEKAAAPMPPNHPPMGSMQQGAPDNPMMQPEGPVLQGKVVEITDGAGYSYLLLEAGGKQFWIAGTQVSAKQGDTVSYIENVIMENFQSKSLNKTFDRIVFASSVKVVP